MRSYLVLAAWTVLAGAGIPLIGILNAGVARSLGNPFAATAAMFAVAFTVAAGIALAAYGPAPFARLGEAPLGGYGAGLLIAFYALSATIAIPRMGAASFVAFILVAQLVTSAIVDQFGLLGMARRPVDLPRLVGLAAILGGIVVMEIGNLRSGRE